MAIIGNIPYFQTNPYVKHPQIPASLMFNQGIPVITGQEDPADAGVPELLASCTGLWWKGLVVPVVLGRTAGRYGIFFALKFQYEAKSMNLVLQHVTKINPYQLMARIDPNSCFSLGSTLDVCKTRWIMTAARVQVLVGLLVPFLSVITLSDWAQKCLVKQPIFFFYTLELLLMTCSGWNLESLCHPTQWYSKGVARGFSLLKIGNVLSYKLTPGRPFSMKRPWMALISSPVEGSRNTGIHTSIS